MQAIFQVQAALLLAPILGHLKIVQQQGLQMLSLVEQLAVLLVLELVLVAGLEQ